MSGRLLVKGKDPSLDHTCDPPGGVHRGTLWVCDCGRHWLYGPYGIDEYGHGKWWRPVSTLRARWIIKRAQP